MRLLWVGFLLSVGAAAQGSRPPACSCTSQIVSYEAGNEPLCDGRTRGQTVVILGGTGQSDLLETCLRNAAGNFAWVSAGQQNTNTFVNSRMAGNCPIFPDNNVWNTPIDSLQVDPESAGIIATYALSRVGTTPEFSLNLASSVTPAFRVTFGASDQSDGGSYPIAPNMLVEGYQFNGSFPVSSGPYNGDAHLLVVQTNECKLYEIFGLASAAPPYNAGSGAVFDLLQNDLRPDGYTSADAAGLPIWPGVLTYAEVYGSSEIQHMVRFTVNATRDTYIWPARHYASHNDSTSVPPMGSRWRLKAAFNDSTCVANDNTGQAFPPEAQRIIRALKKYGMILADNGSPILITADTDPRWGDPNAPASATYRLNGWMHCIRGSDFEVVDTSTLVQNPNSAVVAK